MHSKELGEAVSAATEEERKNRNFTQVYPKGWRRLRWLMTEKPSAAQLYTFIAENMDPDGGALVISQVVMAEELGVSEITIRRLTKWMEEKGVLARIRVGTGVYAYALSEEEVWRAWDTQKETAVFRTRTLVKKSDRHNATVSRRIRVMMKEAQRAEENPGIEFDPETGESSE
jgi:DNA-binding transcriptional regulator YhcF (GntR family)